MTFKRIHRLLSCSLVLCFIGGCVNRPYVNRNPAKESPAPPTAKALIRLGMSRSDFMDRISASGQCHQVLDTQPHSKVIYVQCVLTQDVIVDVENSVGSLSQALTGIPESRVSLSPGTWTWMFTDDQLANYKPTLIPN